MKTLLKLLLVISIASFGSLAYAGETNTTDYSEQDIEEIEAERYEQIEGKWEVEVEFEDDDKKFYVYNIDDEEELVSEITDHLNENLGFSLSESEVEDLLDVDYDEFEDEDEDEELEIEAERYKSVDGKWKVEAEFNDKDVLFYVYNIDSEDELVGEIADYLNNKYDLGLSDDEVEGSLEIEDDFEDEDKEEKAEKDNKEKDDKKGKEVKTSDADKDELIRLLIIALITILAQSDEGSNIDLSALLESL